MAERGAARSDRDGIREHGPVSRARAAAAAVLWLAAALLAPPALAEPGATFGAETFTLDNGMQVVVIPNQRAPVIHHSVWYRVGAADGPRGKSGIAHMLEHLMFKGTEHIPAGEFSKTIARNGGNDNAFTSQDYTGYFQNVSPERLVMVMEMEADRMVNLSFAENDFLTERDVVAEERRSRTGNQASALFAEQVNASQYLAHPYRLPIIGWDQEIQDYTYDDAVDFYRSYYAPNNAILIVAGDVTAGTLRPLAERTYGRIPARAVAARARAVEPPQLAARRVLMRDARVADPEWMRSYLVPSYHADPEGQAVAIDVLANVLGGGITGRLYQGLVVDRQVANSAGSFYDGLTYDRSRLIVYVRPRPGQAIEEVEAAVDEVLAEVMDRAVDADELARAKFGMRADAVYARDQLASVARIFGVALTAGLSVADVEGWPELVESVTAEQVQAAARAVLVPARSVTGVLLPESKESL